MSKLTLLHIHIIGTVVALFLAGILWFTLIKPKNEESESTKANIESTKSAGGTQQKIDEQDRTLKSTQKEAAQTKKDWAVNEVKYMPALPYNEKTNTLDLYFFPTVGRGKTGFRDIPTVWGQWLTAWYDAQRNQGIARMPGTEFPIHGFEPDPNTLSTRLADHLTFPEDGKKWEKVAIECKTFDDALNHLHRFNHMERHGMPVIDNVAINGQSPNLQLIYDLGLYIIPRTSAPSPDPMINSSGAPAAPAGGGAPANPLAGATSRGPAPAGPGVSGGKGE